MMEMNRSEIVAVMEYIKGNLDRKLTLAHLAEYAKMSTATLNRRFREALGSSPMTYVLSCRISRARELMADGTLSRTEVAQMCGFYDLAHMNKYLK
jgi:AraC family transcriptional regulator